MFFNTWQSSNCVSRIRGMSSEKSGFWEQKIFHLKLKYLAWGASISLISVGVGFIGGATKTYYEAMEQKEALLSQAALSVDHTMYSAQNIGGEKSARQRWDDMINDQIKDLRPEDKVMSRSTKTSEGLAYYYHESIIQSKGTVVYLHGRPGVDGDMSNLMKELNYDHNIIIISKPGYEPSSGNSDVLSIIRQTKSALDEITKLHTILPQNIVILGHSIGALESSVIAREMQVKGVVFLKPAVSLHDSCEFRKLDEKLCNLLRGNGRPDLRDNVSYGEIVTVKIIGINDAIVHPESQRQIPTDASDFLEEDHFYVNKPRIKLWLKKIFSGDLRPDPERDSQNSISVGKIT
jgi:pimeloyl-ACP methyl ester carboxylesterase